MAKLLNEEQRMSVQRDADCVVVVLSWDQTKVWRRDAAEFRSTVLKETECQCRLRNKPYYSIRDPGIIVLASGAVVL